MNEHHDSEGSVVKKGGRASDAEAGDVTRDTYGFSEGVEEGDDASKAEARRKLEQILPDEGA